MTDKLLFSRRRLIAAGTLGTAGLLAGCDKLDNSPAFKGTLRTMDGWHQDTQQLLGRGGLAREYAASEMSPVFRPNGSRTAGDPTWLQDLATGFATYALKVDGLVARPLALPLSALEALPQRVQITRHDCVEGWSAIGKWQGPQLGAVLRLAGLRREARFIVFHCADRFGALPYYESIDLADAFHPQTILAWRMNDRPLEVQHGAPIRLRVERQLGYKHAKFVQRIEAVASLSGVYGGQGGFWEDTTGYQWYAGI
jgi:DMSO/TMAO reductase YedYZ molybdopterin-dependent catalytic subunit